MSNSGAIQQQIGPLKTFVSKHQQEAKEALQRIKDSEPEDITSLRRAIQVLNRCYERLQSSNSKLSEKNDEWAALLKTAPDDQADYDSACAEIMNLLLESDELFTDISTDVNDLQAELDNLAESASQDDTKQSPGQADSAPQSHHNPQSGTSGPPAPTHHGGSGAFKAPKFRLPTFSGDYMQFKQFWSIFEANIHNRTDFRPIEKFTYLLSQLEGDAKKVLTGVPVTDDNYDVAVALLKSRFDRADDRLTTMLYSEFIRIPTCSSKLADKLRTLDDCESVFRQLETPGEDINANKSLVFCLLSKFPGDMVKDLQRHYSVGANNTLREVRSSLQKSLLEEEMTDGMLNDMQSIQQGRDTTRGGLHAQKSYDYESVSPSDGERGFALALPTMTFGHRKQSAGAQMLSPPKACYFCGDDHFNGACMQYPTAECRRQRLNELDRCTRCSFFHRGGGTQCPFPIKCVHCRTDEDHASALCDQTYPSQLAQAGAGDIQANDPSDSVIRNPDSGGLTALNCDSKSTLFPTAKTTIINPVTGKECTARIALDTLSSRNYIRVPVAQSLGLTGGPAKKLLVSVFGTTKSLVVPTENVEFDVKFRDGTRFRVKANTTNVICRESAMPNDWTVDENKAISYFLPALADDPYDDNGTIDILIGASLVWEFVEGRRMQTTVPNLFLLPSKFGLLLSGESQHVNDNPQPSMLCLTTADSSSIKNYEFVAQQNVRSTRCANGRREITKSCFDAKSPLPTVYDEKTIVPSWFQASNLRDPRGGLDLASMSNPQAKVDNSIRTNANDVSRLSNSPESFPDTDNDIRIRSSKRECTPESTVRSKSEHEYEDPDFHDELRKTIFDYVIPQGFPDHDIRRQQSIRKRGRHDPSRDGIAQSTTPSCFKEHDSLTFDETRSRLSDTTAELSQALRSSSTPMTLPNERIQPLYTSLSVQMDTGRCTTDSSTSRFSTRSGLYKRTKNASGGNGPAKVHVQDSNVLDFV